MSDESMSSDDTDFNPDALEALSAKEEYDSEPSTTSSDTDGEENGSDAERRRAERKKKKEEKAERQKKRSSEKKERKSKKTKLPGQPKRAMSAYFIWMNENRESIKEKHPGLSVTEFGKKAGEMWKGLSDKSVILICVSHENRFLKSLHQQEWEKKAADDKKRYEAEMEKWKAEGGLEAMKAAKKAAKKQKAAASGSATKSKSKSSAAASASAAAASSAGSGAGFKSKEFIESDSSSDDDDKKKKKSSKNKKASSDEDMKSASGSASSAASDDDSD